MNKISTTPRLGSRTKSTELKEKQMETQSTKIKKTKPATATGEMSVMGREGDTKFYWDVHNWTEVEAAKATFDLYKGKGFAAFHMTPKGKQDGEQMKDFDPAAGRILFIPQMQGG